MGNIHCTQQIHNKYSHKTMETIFLGIVGFLMALAIFDLSVGVSNDAVNFINSAVGSRAARFKVILGIAAVGIFV